MYEQRDIVLIPFPYTDLTGAKQRPALVLSNNTINSGKDRICCLITSKRTSDGIKLEKEELEGSLPLESWVKPYRVFTIHETIVKKRLCSVSKAIHKRILRQLNRHISLGE